MAINSRFYSFRDDGIAWDESHHFGPVRWEKYGSTLFGFVGKRLTLFGHTLFSLSNK